MTGDIYETSKFGNKLVGEKFFQFDLCPLP